ncbi:Hypothetical predicted protein [Paramuricea clavata]|uniref:Uncharacterized protein n=1 Tax=Paramuricea clavata TaxID=317549 RepID=A0A7D9I7E9_PARCT|nr:Hypothetical predicted protein [Paramuricea clavata]
MERVDSLKVLNDDQEIHKMSSKLPKWALTRWGRKVYAWKNEKKRFPPFSEFVKYVVVEADITCDPINLSQRKIEIYSRGPRRQRTMEISEVHLENQTAMSLLDHWQQRLMKKMRVRARPKKSNAQCVERPMNWNPVRTIWIWRSKRGKSLQKRKDSALDALERDICRGIARDGKSATHAKGLIQHPCMET